MSGWSERKRGCIEMPPTFDRLAPWRAAKDAGMLDVATITTTEGTADFDVKYRRPDGLMLNGDHLSTDHQIKFVADELPTLKEGDAVVFDPAKSSRFAETTTFRVRQAPSVPNDWGRGTDGTFKYALLSLA